MTLTDPATYDRLDRALGGEVIPVISKWAPAEKAAFERAVRAGKLAKWRGFWFPVCGAHYGIGPLKTCYGTPAQAKFFADWYAQDRAAGAKSQAA